MRQEELEGRYGHLHSPERQTSDAICQRTLKAAKNLARQYDRVQAPNVLTDTERLLRNPLVLLDRVPLRTMGEEAKQAYSDFVTRGFELGVAPTKPGEQPPTGSEARNEWLAAVKQGTEAIQERAYAVAYDAYSDVDPVTYVELALMGSTAFAVAFKEVGDSLPGDLRNYFDGNSTSAIIGNEQEGDILPYPQ